jgi:hypothetical protein
MPKLNWKDQRTRCGPLNTIQIKTSTFVLRVINYF